MSVVAVNEKFLFNPSTFEWKCIQDFEILVPENFHGKFCFGFIILLPMYVSYRRKIDLVRFLCCVTAVISDLNIIFHLMDWLD